MFESLVANLLNRFLGSYLENFDTKQLNIGIWSGDVKLTNLRLKKESLDKLKLPVNVTFGHLGVLTLQIPWSNLKGKPVRIIIEDLYLLATPADLSNYDAEDDEKRQEAVKQDKLKQLETFLEAQSEELGKDLVDSTFAESLITKIVDNLQVTIKNIHLKYEDDSVLTENPYSLGATLGELSAVSTDENWHPSFIAITQVFARKLLTLDKFACYMNTREPQLLSDLDRNVILEKFQSNTVEEEYLMKPITGNGRITIHKAGATKNQPHLESDLSFEEFGLELNAQQYEDILWTASKFHWYMKTAKFRKLRPKVSPSEDPKAWFKYSAECVLNEIHEKHYKWSWEYFQKRRDQRIAYLKLWKLKLDRTISPEEEKELQQLEWDLSFDDIKLYRSLARNELKRSGKIVRLFDTEAADQNEKKNAGWFSGWWGGGNKQSEEKKKDTLEADGEHTAVSLNDDQRKSLYDTIDYDAKAQASDIDLPNDCVKNKISAVLNKGGLVIKKDYLTSLAEIAFEGCEAKFFQRPESFLASFQMSEFKVEDGTNSSIYKHLISVKEASNDDTAKSHDPFFQVSYEQNPLDGRADSELLGRLKSMTIFYNPKFVENLIQFFTPPKIHLDTVGAIMNAAESTVEGLTSQTRMGLEYALEEHKTINVKLDLQAPLVILPLDPSSYKSPVAILDAGHVSVVSDLIEKSKIKEYKDKEKYTDKDWQNLKELLYDQFKLSLIDAQFLVGQNIKTTMEQLYKPDVKRSAVMLDNLNLNINLGISILPDAKNLPKMRLGGGVPKINIAMNDFQYKTIMSILEAAIPNTGTSNTDESSVFATYGDTNTQKDGISIDDHVSSDEKSNQSLKKKNDIEQKLIEIEFEINSIIVSLSRCINGVTLEAEPLIDIVGDGLSLSLFKTETELHLDMSLIDFNIEDCLEKSGVAKFNNLISSNSNSKSKKILQINLSRFQRLVDFKGSQIEVFDQDIDMQIATVEIVITRKSILSILAFCMNTFTDPNAQTTPADELSHNDANEEAAPQKINMKLGLDSIIIALNEDGRKLATFELSLAQIKLFLLPESIDVTGKIGALSLVDNYNSGATKLIHMDGNNLAEFNYKTFDIHGIRPAEVAFKTNSLSINFIESSFNRLISYSTQFMQMKAIYDSTREAAMNQATQLPTKIKFDVVVQAPNITFPFGLTGDKIVVDLGELYAQNVFKGDVNTIEAGVRNINLQSELKFDKVQQNATIVDDLDITFNVDWCEIFKNGVPTFDIIGKIPQLNINLTELQLKLITQLFTSISETFGSENSSTNFEEIEEEANYANEVLKHNTKIVQGNRNDDAQTAIAENSSDKEEIPKDHKMANFKFSVPQISLTLYNDTDGIENITSQKFSTFSLNDFDIVFDLAQDQSFNSKFAIKSFVVEDVREKTQNKFPVLIPAAKDVENQFVLQLISDGSDTNKSITTILTVQKPKVILALDYLFNLQDFFIKSKPSSQRPELQPRQSRKSITSFPGNRAHNEEEVSTTAAKLGLSINITNPSIFLLADETRADTEAIAFKVEQILITKQNILSIATSKIGLYLARMDDPKNAIYRIIDDFTISFAYDNRKTTATKFLDNIQASIEPLVIRVSVRDIRLGLSIINKANDLLAKNKQSNPQSEKSDQSSTLSHTPSVISNALVTSSQNNESQKSLESEDNVPTVRGEEATINFGGLRFVLIGDVSELPVIDANLKPFEFHAINWSTDLTAEIHLESFLNIYNYAKSTWEPMIEPWPVAIYASQKQGPDSKLLIEVVSRHLAEVTITSRSVALLSQMQYLLSTEEQLKPRGQDYPFVIINDTGIDLNIWSDGKKQATKTTLNYGESKPWTFEDWRKIRENLDADTSSTLGISFKDDAYESISQLSAASVGEELFALEPSIDGVHNRLCVSITLAEDNVKIITLRSTVLIENDADVPIDIEIFDQNKTKQLLIKSKQNLAIPIDFVYNGKLRMKPHLHTSFNWSEECINWKEVMKGNSDIAFKCPATKRGDTSVYYFQTEASYDKQEPLAQVYPHMKFIISAPLEIENLLPYDFSYRLYDKNSRREWTGEVKKGIKSYVHVASLKNLLLLSIEPLHCEYGKSEFAIINCPKQNEFRRENILSLRGDNKLKLNIHYPKKQADSTSLKVIIYSPYVILNRSNLNIFANERGNVFESLGKSIVSDPINPTMFSFDKNGDKRNRATIKSDDTVWSRPMSFDTIGQSSHLSLQMLGKQKEINLGVTISEGEGAYNLIKTVIIAPRYVVVNKLGEDLLIVEEGVSKECQVAPNKSIPLYGMRCLEKKNLMFKFRHSSRWSQPFSIDNVGLLFIKVQKQNEVQVLLKVTLLLEDATMFIHVEDGNNQWPYAIKNYTDEEFYIYQGNPNINANGELVKTETPYKPIYYKIPPKSIMPYAYDYPNAILKELIVKSHDRERAVNLAEIGNLKPFRLPATDDQGQCIVDLNVAADGPIQALIITNYDPSKSLYQVKGGNSSTVTASTSQDYFVEADTEDNYHVQFVTKFEGLGVSLINTKDKEICYITMRGLEFRYNESNLFQNYSLKLKWLQIDNQLYGAIFPIVLYPTVIPNSGKELNDHPAFSASICKVKDDAHGVLFLKYATVLLQALTLEIDEDFLYALIDFAKFPGAAWNKEQVDRLYDGSLDIPEPVQLNEASDIYFEALHLQPIKANISFVRTERIDVDDKTSSQNAIMFFLNVLTMAIGNINDAPIRLNALFIENIRVPTPILIESIRTHYSQAFFYQIYNILGSADFLGNPVGLFNLLSSGVMDIFYEPYQGFVLTDRPQELGIGLAKGGLSFLKKSVFGFSDSISKVTGSLAKGLTVATMDPKFQERRRLQTGRRNKPNHALYGFTAGASSFFESIASGVEGVASAPIEGADEDGAAGFFKGLGKGLIGLPTKTAIGVLDLASNVSEGIRNTTTVFDGEGLDKVRLPRYINPDGIIEPYSERDSQGQYWMVNIDKGRFWNQTYLAHLILPGDEMAVLLTFKFIILFDIKNLKSRWCIKFDTIKSISVEPTGLSIYLKNRQGPFIPIPERKNRDYLYNKIAVAVKEYNKSCRVAL
ncbi:VPS13 [Candida pseudojiufengensis]|uniref:VPS13 n=1 Tax=Candida pseudojiufengensis TaxID=497109 RepID=UPI002224DE70|nr:VPS13 [Candida pseudojiufengensis]KAI5965822.1 VPS13 [Candida pseudojiufengensis]